MLTWKTLRELTYHPSRSHPKRANWPTGLGNITAHEHLPNQIAYAVTMTKGSGFFDMSFEVFEMVLIALGRKDVLQYMQQEDMQKANLVDI